QPARRSRRTRFSPTSRTRQSQPALREQLPVERVDVVDEAVDPVPRNRSLAPSPPELAAQIGGAREPLERGDDRVDVTDAGQEAAALVLDDVRNPAHACR